MPQYIRSVIYFFFLVCSVSIVGACTSNNKEEAKPNVVFILADDLGYYDLSYTGSTFYETPNLDKLAKGSFRFTNGYACAPVCSPSRASIMTGNFTATHGITDWIGAATGEDWRNPNHEDKLLPPNYLHAMKKEWVTMPEAFQSEGYKTFFAGKWHLGEGEESPEAHGFEINKGGWLSGSPAGGYFSPWKNPKLPNTTPTENLSIRLAKETATFIDQNQEAPFFAFLSFYAVHSPIQTTEQKWRYYRDKAAQQGIKEKGFMMEEVLPIRTVQDNPVYAGLIQTMDEAIGIVLQQLEDSGLSDNTIIVFTSDNGGVASGDAYSTSNLPLRGGKGYSHEGGIREPFFIKVPGKKGQTQGYPASGADFYPTLASLAEIPQTEKLDGVDLSPLFEGASLPERPIYWHYPHYGNQGGKPHSAIRLGNYKLIHYWEDQHQELYNLKEDSGEKNDLTEELPELSEKLSKALMDFLESRDSPMPQKDELYSPERRAALQSKRSGALLESLETQRINYLNTDYQPNSTWWDSQSSKIND